MEAILSRHFHDPDPADLRVYERAGNKKKKLRNTKTNK